MATPEQIARRWAERCEDEANKHYRWADETCNPEWRAACLRIAESNARAAFQARENLKKEAA